MACPGVVRLITHRVVGQFHVNSPGLAQLIDHGPKVNSKLTHYGPSIWLINLTTPATV
jgi:hypothetical protein